MTESRSPRFIQSRVAEAGPEARARRAARDPAEHRAEVLLRRPRLAPVRGDHRAARSTTRPAPRRRSSPPTAPRCAPRSAPARILVDLGAGNCAKAVSLFPRAAAEALRRGRRLGRVPARSAAPACSASIRSSTWSGWARTFRPASTLPADLLGGGAPLFFYPGSSIGNFTRDEASPSCAGSTRAPRRRPADRRRPGQAARRCSRPRTTTPSASPRPSTSMRCATSTA